MIKNVQELTAIRDAYAGKINFRQHSANTEVSDGNIKKHVLICGGTGLYVQGALFNYEFKAQKRDFDFGKK